MGSFSSRWLDFAPTRENPTQTLEGTPDKTDESPKTTPAEAPVLDAGTLPRLPWQLERLTLYFMDTPETLLIHAVPD